MTEDQINLAMERITGQRRDYCHDLNAIHRAVFELKIGSVDHPSEYESYCEWLDNITGGDGYSATALQRSEAFLRALGKWKE